jgi:hypothetical protein
MAVFNSFIIELDLDNNVLNNFKTNKEAEGYSIMFLGMQKYFFTVLKVFLLFLFLDFPENRFTKTNFSYRDSFQSGTQLLLSYIKYKYLAHRLTTRHPFNLIVVLRTSSATVRNWILSLLPENLMPSLLNFLNNLENETNLLTHLERSISN